MSGLKVTTRPGLRVYRGAPRPPLRAGACPHCFRVIQSTARLRRRAHIDPATGTRCTGSGITIGVDTSFDLPDLPPVSVIDRAVNARSTVAVQHGRYVLTSDGTFTTYEGRSDREAANGRMVCPNCARHIPLNSDGAIRRHRIRREDPLAPYCEGES